MSIKDIIVRNFSRCAEKYEAYCEIQDYAARSLIELAEGERPGSILDIGCGPGNYTRLLKERFTGAVITAVDISRDMIQTAKKRLPEGVRFITADAEVIDFAEKFDLVTSNVSFQWLGDLQGTMSRYKKMLSESGYMLFSIFGPATFNELNEVVQELYKDRIEIMSQSFCCREAIEKVLTHDFEHVHIAEELIKKEYMSLWQLLNTIKYTGTRGFGLQGKHLSKKKIDELEKIYKAKFGSIIVTYQIFYCRARVN